MYDYSLEGILREIEGLTTSSLIYIIGGGFVLGAIAGFYWGIKKAVIAGGIGTIAFFLFMSYREVGFTPAILDTFFSYFQGVLYMLIGVIAGAVMSHLIFNVN